MNKINEALKSLEKGNFVLIHDSSGRENETDFVIAAQFAKPAHIAQMRNDGGGLICICVDKRISEKLQLPFYVDIHNEASSRFPVLDLLKANDIPYDEKSSFSLCINHRKTFTGITDNDRAMTIKKFAELCKNPSAEEFGKQFRSPGHVHLLISSGLENREGHTELSTALLEMANIAPVSVLCEMMDDETHNAVTRDKAYEYAKTQGLVFLEAGEIKEKFYKFKNLRNEKWQK
ncbi:3,4-dihydroxy-2-butanone-4-phosphate synthase [Candidatus Altiarchaeales archaeon WOR_SM1_SCG]|nr:3,4-dihydroxy-2-butanone-4-phosphate synthase [Candidatus Altiarchaeales archaeon WOR_SM1_SCG]